MHVVQSGDTLYSISNRYQIEMRDIAYINKLNAPFNLAGGQRLKLPPPQKYKVRSGDTLYEISRLFNTNTSDVARQNNLAAPYKLKAGQTLKMPSSVPAPRPAPVVRMANVKPPPVKPYQQSQAAGNVLRVPEGAQESRLARERDLEQELQQERIAEVEVPKVLARPVKISSTPPVRTSSKFLQPVDGKVISGYGPKKDGLHNDGINIAASKGAPVKAAENGVVVYVGNELKGSGNLILVRHADRYMSAYAHLDQLLVQRGQTVQRGQSIGTVGSTGSVSAPQLHFELRRGTQAIDPQGHVGT